MAARKSMNECCFIKTVDRQIVRQKSAIDTFTAFGTFLPLAHTEAIAIEMAQCREGHTPVLVSMLYMKATMSVKRFSLGKNSGRRSCLLGKTI
jgi:hypothetical protein